jgi:hypothetical protein
MKKNFLVGIMVYTYNLSTPEAEAGVSQVQGQPGLYSKTPFLNIENMIMSLLEVCRGLVEWLKG